MSYSAIIIYINIKTKGTVMKSNVSLKFKNFILTLIFLSISILCTTEFFCSTMLIIFPHFTCYFKDTLGYSLYQTSELYRFLHNNREITTCILGCLYFIFFRVYVFQKWVSIIENKCQGLFLHDFLKELRENKQILLYVNIIFLFFLFIMLDFYIEVSDINVFFATLFFIPFHYLILYIRWAIKDKNYKNKQIRTKKYHIIQYINFFVLSNIQVIFYPIIMGLYVLAGPTYILKILCFILLLLTLFYIIGFVIYCIMRNIKLMIYVLTVIFVPICMIFLSLECGMKVIDKIFYAIYISIHIITILIGTISSIFIDKISN